MITDFVECRFPVSPGRIISSINGYYVRCGLLNLIGYTSKTQESLGWVVESPDVLINSLSGHLVGRNQLETQDFTTLAIRCKTDKASNLMLLADKDLRIGHGMIRLGIPSFYPINPFPSLFSRMVKVCLFGEPKKTRYQVPPDLFLTAVNRQIAMLGIIGDVSLATHPDGTFQKQVVKIRGFIQVGYSIIVQNLSDEDSYKLQSVGIGGSRKMGCGFFRPLREIVGVI